MAHSKTDWKNSKEKSDQSSNHTRWTDAPTTALALDERKTRVMRSETTIETVATGYHEESVLNIQTEPLRVGTNRHPQHTIPPDGGTT